MDVHQFLRSYISSLAIILISNNNISLTKLIDELWDRSNISEKMPDSQS